MTQNLLTQRIKDIKRELTALKTTHERGLGLLKIYTFTGEANPPDTSKNYDFTATVYFDNNFGAYPFTQMLRVSESPTSTWFGSKLEIENQHYADNGYSLVVSGYYSGSTNGSKSYLVDSTSPISNVVWSFILV